MYLARRETGKALRVYRNCGAERIPRAWLFDGRHPETGLPTSAAMSANVFSGVSATGNTYSEAVANLHLAEEAALHA